MSSSTSFESEEWDIVIRGMYLRTGWDERRDYKAVNTVYAAARTIPRDRKSTLKRKQFLAFLQVDMSYKESPVPARITLYRTRRWRGSHEEDNEDKDKNTFRPLHPHFSTSKSLHSNIRQMSRVPCPTIPQDVSQFF